MYVSILNIFLKNNQNSITKMRTIYVVEKAPFYLRHNNGNHRVGRWLWDLCGKRPQDTILSVCDLPDSTCLWTHFSLGILCCSFIGKQLTCQVEELPCSHFSANLGNKQTTVDNPGDVQTTSLLECWLLGMHGPYSILFGWIIRTTAMPFVASLLRSYSVKLRPQCWF